MLVQTHARSIHQITVLPYKGIRHLEVEVNNARRRTRCYLNHCKVARQTSTPTIPEPFHNGKDRSACARAVCLPRLCGTVILCISFGENSSVEFP